MIEVNYYPYYNLVTVKVIRDLEESDIKENEEDILNLIE